MSKSFEDYIEKYFCGNPHLYQEMLEIQLHIEEQEYWKEREKTNPFSSTIDKWEKLNKPNLKNNYLKP
tara:strand:- start:103 stop:306 length:204 start_codon:yes stop_codon:yes gene_type:complete